MVENRQMSSVQSSKTNANVMRFRDSWVCLKCELKWNPIRVQRVHFMSLVVWRTWSIPDWRSRRLWNELRQLHNKEYLSSTINSRTPISRWMTCTNWTKLIHLELPITGLQSKEEVLILSSFCWMRMTVLDTVHIPTSELRRLKDKMLSLHQQAVWSPNSSTVTSSKKEAELLYMASTPLHEEWWLLNKEPGSLNRRLYYININSNVFFIQWGYQARKTENWLFCIICLDCSKLQEQCLILEGLYSTFLYVLDCCSFYFVLVTIAVVTCTATNTLAEVVKWTTSMHAWWLYSQFLLYLNL